jgi:hypothetical protein
MASRPTNVTVRQDLTNYAHGITQDLDGIKKLAALLAPVVPTGGTSGLYNKFDATQAFKDYASAVSRRAVGGHAANIEFLSTTANYNASPFGLRISIDEHERQQAGPLGGTLLEQAKTRTLTINCYLSYLSAVVTAVKAAVSAAAGKGAWNNANVDPIAEINEQIKAVWLATGVLPNNVVMDFGAWCVLSDNPIVLKRMPGADIAQVSPARISKLLVNPNAVITVAETAILYGGGLGNTSATRRGIIGGSALICYNSAFPSPYDPSFCKTFAPSASLFTEVYSYREEPHLDWYQNDWTCDIAVVAASLCKRIDVTGAND